MQSLSTRLTRSKNLLKEIDCRDKAVNDIVQELIAINDTITELEVAIGKVKTISNIIYADMLFSREELSAEEIMILLKQHKENTDLFDILSDYIKHSENLLSGVSS